MSLRNRSAAPSGAVVYSVRAYPDMPGDTQRELAGTPAWDDTGKMWPVGTVFSPMSCGFSRSDNGEVQEVRINGETVRFVRRSDKQEEEYQRSII
mgnify:CR=1 FL=1